MSAWKIYFCVDSFSITSNVTVSHLVRKGMGVSQQDIMPSLIMICKFNPYLFANVGVAQLQTISATT